ncbi:hypothetical protein LRP67_01035 [Nocardioides sp. cx-169]|uniref:hypothetical protein n=1 Tax=Nocardioides sp. cx-169 TaxID=2899080 RepID=UPI001E49EC3E|nr:hypothetical protein [Nocardioides sp. cx-169]MCD4532673.1 hypothetical protein [Nocardioides sp. cx-169]
MPATFWELLQHYCDDTGATEAAVQRKARLNHGTFTAWRARGVPALPRVDVVVALADTLRVDYEDLVRALLVSAEYLPAEVARARASGPVSDRAEAPTAARAGTSRGRRLREEQDDAATRPTQDRTEA